MSDRVFAERALAVSEQRRREILATMLQAEEVERSRIATELHDDTVQVMAASLMALDRAFAPSRVVRTQKGGSGSLGSGGCVYCV